MPAELRRIESNSSEVPPRPLPCSEPGVMDQSPAHGPPPENTTVHGGSRKRGRGIRAFFRSAWNFLKKPFRDRRQRKVGSLVPLVSKEEPVPKPEPATQEPEAIPEPASTPELEPIPGPSGLQSSVRTEPSSVTVASDYEAHSGDLKDFYTLGDFLGEGSYGVVCKGLRKSDGKEVAIKRSSKSVDVSFIDPDYPIPLYREVALLVMLRRPPTCPYVIELYDWFDRDHALSLVMEFPQPCTTLNEFISMVEGIPEEISKVFMLQLVQAVQHCISRGVFHNDVHLANILVNVNPLQLKLIDFGLAHLVDENGYDSSLYSGAFQCMPPEAFERPRYHAVPTSVWFLGLVLFTMVNGRKPFLSAREMMCRCTIDWVPSASVECKDLTMKCLKRRPELRPTLEEILQHPWLTAEM
ncbi:hypothetical protein DNTS_013849 [Danionella cerebrum]|uniref:non-specific serine/threonine protein kinase n=1 Tax=Danionella cerebrum TaxID=2873325 RepID=A0A553P5I8_9TELE|nr:hypothetical protein DNTS_013849 [Danionella translucida]